MSSNSKAETTSKLFESVKGVDVVIYGSYAVYFICEYDKSVFSWILSTLFWKTDFLIEGGGETALTGLWYG